MASDAFAAKLKPDRARASAFNLKYPIRY